MTEAEKLDEAERIIDSLAKHCRESAANPTGDDEDDRTVSAALSNLQASSYEACAEIIRDVKRGRT